MKKNNKKVVFEYSPWANNPYHEADGFKRKDYYREVIYFYVDTKEVLTGINKYDESLELASIERVLHWFNNNQLRGVVKAGPYEIPNEEYALEKGKAFVCKEGVFMHEGKDVCSYVGELLDTNRVYSVRLDCDFTVCFEDKQYELNKNAEYTLLSEYTYVTTKLENQKMLVVCSWSFGSGSAPFAIPNDKELLSRGYVDLAIIKHPSYIG